MDRYWPCLSLLNSILKIVKIIYVFIVYDVINMDYGNIFTGKWCKLLSLKAPRHADRIKVRN